MLRFPSEHQKSLHYERKFGRVVFSDIRTVKDSHPAERYDIRVIEVEPSWRADNCMAKLRAIGAFDFDGGADKISWPDLDYQISEEVLKLGIRTGLTFGTVLSPVSVNWDMPPFLNDEDKANLARVEEKENMSTT